MRPKIIIAAAVLAAFLGGVVIEGYLKPRMSQALSSRGDTVAPSAAVRRVPARNVVYREAPATSTAYSEPSYRRHRTWEREALIIGGSAGAGTAIGALAGGKKGAGIGAVSGGIGGLVYDLATRNR
jgi:hypothetical protein